MKSLFLLGLIMVGLLSVGGANAALAWYGPGQYSPSGYCSGDDNCCCSPDTGGQYCQNECSPPVTCGGYCAGQQDAQYDMQNSLPYQPYGSCLPCHSSGYWDNFRQGYDNSWNNHQEQNQGSSVNVNNSPGAYVSVNQYQQQNPLQQLAHLACGFVNCGGQGGYQNGPS